MAVNEAVLSYLLERALWQRGPFGSNQSEKWEDLFEGVECNGTCDAIKCWKKLWDYRKISLVGWNYITFKGPFQPKLFYGLYCEVNWMLFLRFQIWFSYLSDFPLWGGEGKHSWFACRYMLLALCCENTVVKSRCLFHPEKWRNLHNVVTCYCFLVMKIFILETTPPKCQKSKCITLTNYL